ncbi:hypothetical protein P3T22_000139 [Paraburkholderia sp. GAS348]
MGILAGAGDRVGEWASGRVGEWASVIGCRLVVQGALPVGDGVVWFMRIKRGVRLSSRNVGRCASFRGTLRLVLCGPASVFMNARQPVRASKCRAAVPPCRRAAVPPCRRAAVPPCRRAARIMHRSALPHPTVATTRWSSNARGVYAHKDVYTKWLAGLDSDPHMPLAANSRATQKRCGEARSGQAGSRRIHMADAPSYIQGCHPTSHRIARPLLLLSPPHI